MKGPVSCLIREEKIKKALSKKGEAILLHIYEVQEENMGTNDSKEN